MYVFTSSAKRLSFLLPRFERVSIFHTVDRAFAKQYVGVGPYPPHG